MRLRRFLHPFIMLAAILVLLCFTLPDNAILPVDNISQQSTTESSMAPSTTLPTPNVTNNIPPTKNVATTSEASEASASTSAPSKTGAPSSTNGSGNIFGGKATNDAPTKSQTKPLVASAYQNNVPLVVTTIYAPKPTTTGAQTPKSNKPFRAVWISYMELPKATVTKEQYAATADKIFSNIANVGFNAAFVHVIPFADSIYPSQIFPWSRFVTGINGKVPDYDPLAILLKSAKKYGIAFHVWINPFRVQSSDTDESKLPPDSPAAKWLKDPAAKAKGLVIKTAGGIYFNPAASEVHALICNGVREILRNYDVDGIHLDDYFYPSQDITIDSIQYTEYKRGGGTLPLDNWRRASVNAFIAGLYQTVKSEKPGTVFSISPGGNIQRNREELYADAAHWVSAPGYVDMIIPQLYYGFENQAMPFEKAAKQWNDMVKLPSVELVFGLAAYKSGKLDEKAGRGAAEWQRYDDILAREAAFVQKRHPGVGLALYSYAYVLGNKKTSVVETELAKLYAGGVW
ncbi:MAG: family 10 glycosylhydrolase [Oscillospiraceae bacterium]|jgi:uncharacterized lipoprotein YddW (UPF0748 family)|nr:family 10 glycosylhydrolase [Oscillospiraceae bacterium]